MKVKIDSAPGNGYNLFIRKEIIKWHFWKMV